MNGSTGAPLGSIRTTAGRGAMKTRHDSALGPGWFTWSSDYPSLPLEVELLTEDQVSTWSRLLADERCADDRVDGFGIGYPGCSRPWIHNLTDSLPGALAAGHSMYPMPGDYLRTVLLIVHGIKPTDDGAASDGLPELFLVGSSGFASLGRHDRGPVEVRESVDDILVLFDTQSHPVCHQQIPLGPEVRKHLADRLPASSALDSHLSIAIDEES